MRIAVGSLMQETNSLVPFRTTMQSSRKGYPRRGGEVLEGYGAARVEVLGFLSALRAAGAEPVGLLAVHAGSGGSLWQPDFAALVAEMAERLAQTAPIDGVLLALHGAMAVEDAPDAETEIIARLRAVLRPGVPIRVSLDLHGHVTPDMLQPDVFYIGYREYPHTNMFETREWVARLLLDRLRGSCRLVMALAKRPMLVGPISAVTTTGALYHLVAAARAAERAPILHASLFPVQLWFDVPDLGFAVLACADDDVAAAQAVADRLAAQAWHARAEFEPALLPLDGAIRIGLNADGATVVGDSSDAPSSGAAGDNAGVLRALLAAGADRTPWLIYLTLCDAEAAQAAAIAGSGRSVTLSVGHKQTGDSAPVSVTGAVVALTDGSFVMHEAGAEGSTAHMGLTAVVAIGAIRLAVRSLPSYEWDTGIYTSVGLDLRDADLVFVRSPSHFRMAFVRHAARVLLAYTLGACCGKCAA